MKGIKGSSLLSFLTSIYLDRLFTLLLCSLHSKNGSHQADRAQVHRRQGASQAARNQGKDQRLIFSCLTLSLALALVLPLVLASALALLHYRSH